MGFNSGFKGLIVLPRKVNEWDDQKQMWKCVKTDTNRCKMENWKEGLKTELTGKSP